MRLIDADKLPATCTVIVENGHMELTGWILAERINEAPTVEAIPIEWLEKCKDRYILCCTIIDDIIEEWREQNEG